MAAAKEESDDKAVVAADALALPPAAVVADVAPVADAAVDADARAGLTLRERELLLLLRLLTDDERLRERELCCGTAGLAALSAVV